MKMILVILGLLASLAHAQPNAYYPQWSRATETWVTLDNSTSPQVVFANSSTGAGCPSGQWCTVDLTTVGVATDAKSAFLSGMLLITHGNTSQLCDLTVSFRAPNSAMTPNYYLAQAIEAHIGGGQRSTMSTWVPLVSGAFQWQWNRNTQGAWPAECAYGVNLSLQAWVH